MTRGAFSISRAVPDVVAPCVFHEKLGLAAALPRFTGVRELQCQCKHQGIQPSTGPMKLAAGRPASRWWTRMATRA